MSQVTTHQIEDLVSLHPDIVCFGSQADCVGDDWIEKAEQRLGLELPGLYKWFLKTYAGGEIGTEEIYSIYGVDFEGVNGINGDRPRLESTLKTWSVPVFSDSGIDLEGSVITFRHDWCNRWGYRWVSGGVQRLDYQSDPVAYAGKTV
ncbi:SMI1/KNR4 family protein [Pseudomonas fluorescens]|uniref:Knr4/Smi1-like domain-containing protein n=1 Tax=Pseudomonas fluorescens TaxID=294 RepID=A0A5E7UIU0_PSEFL|nr:SMI1/KNR4 family protein [Pseudomonas fluorescens]VVQ07524.1 hypothetical protein PS941_03267 [Pseudomonas fluorescens]